MCSISMIIILNLALSSNNLIQREDSQINDINITRKFSRKISSIRQPKQKNKTQFQVMSLSTTLKNYDAHNQSVFSQMNPSKTDLAQKFRPNRNSMMRSKKKQDKPLIQSVYIHKDQSIRMSGSMQRNSSKKISRLGRYKQRDGSRNIISTDRAVSNMSNSGIRRSSLLNSTKKLNKGVRMRFNNNFSSRKNVTEVNNSSSQNNFKIPSVKNNDVNFSVFDSYNDMSHLSAKQQSNTFIPSRSQNKNDEYGLNQISKVSDSDPFQNNINLDELPDYNSASGDSNLKSMQSFNKSKQDPIVMSKKSSQNNQLQKSSNETNPKKESTIHNINMFNSISESFSKEKANNTISNKNHLSNKKSIISKPSNVNFPNFDDFENFGFSSKNNQSPMKVPLDKTSAQNFSKTNNNNFNNIPETIVINDQKKIASTHSIAVQNSISSFDKKYSKENILELISENEKLKNLLKNQNEMILKLKTDNEELIRINKEKENENQTLIINFETEKSQIMKGKINDIDMMKKRESDFSFQRRSSQKKMEEISLITHILKNEIQEMRGSLDKIKNMKNTISSIKNIKQNLDNKLTKLNFKLSTNKKILKDKTNSLEDFRAQIKKLRKENIELANNSHTVSNKNLSQSEILSYLNQFKSEINQIKLDRIEIINSNKIKLNLLKNEIQQAKSNFNNEMKILSNHTKRIYQEKENMKAKNQKLNEAFEDFKKEMNEGNNLLKPSQVPSQNTSFNMINEFVHENEIKESQIYKDLYQQKEFLEIDLNVNKNKNEDLLAENIKIKNEFNNLTQNIQQENFIQKLKNYEKENYLLNEKNKKLLDELYQEKENNKRFKNLEFMNEELKKSNHELVNQIQKLSNDVKHYEVENPLSTQLHAAFNLPSNLQKKNKNIPTKSKPIYPSYISYIV